MPDRIVLQVVIGDMDSEPKSFTLERVQEMPTIRQLLEQVVAPKLGICMATSSYVACVDNIPVFPDDVISQNAETVTIRIVEEENVFQTDEDSPTILLVEPDQIFRSSLTGMLIGAGYNVVAAHNVASGIQKMRAMGKSLSLVITNWFDGRGYDVVVEATVTSLPYLVRESSLNTLEELDQLLERVGDLVL